MTKFRYLWCSLLAISSHAFAEDRFTSLEIGNFITLGSCATGAAAGVFNASNHKDLDPTWTTLGYLGIGCLLSLPINYFFTPDKERSRVDEIRNLEKTKGELELKLEDYRQKEQKGILGKTPLLSSPFDALNAVLAEFPSAQKTTNIDFSNCKKKSYRLYFNRNALADRADILPADQIPEIAYDQYTTIEVRFRYSDEGCFRPNLFDGKFLKFHWPELGPLLRSAIKKSGEQKP